MAKISDPLVDCVQFHHYYEPEEAFTLEFVERYIGCQATRTTADPAVNRPDPFRVSRGKAEPSSGHASTPPARPSGISIQSKIGVATLLLLSQLTEPRPRSARRKRLGLGVPVVDASLLVTPQHATDRLGDLPRRRGTLAEQFGEDRPHLRHRHRRGFSPPSARAPGRGTTTPEAPA